MDPHLILAYKLARLSPRPFEAAFSSGIAKSDLVEMFSVWQWLTVKLEPAAPSTAPTCVARTDRGEVFLDSTFPKSELDLDMIKEISHHDFEIGGKNQWDGAPTRYSRFILQALSRTHCRDYFPLPVLADLRELRTAEGRPLKALDIGCGPISWLRWGAIEGLLDVTGVDPLLEIYQVILARHGLLTLPFVTPRKAIATGIEELIGEEHRNAYEFVYTNNALDHVQDIRRAISRLHAALSPKGFAFVQVATNEGTRQNWEQLHQHDIDVDGKWLVATRKSGDRYRLAGPGCPPELRKVVHHHAEGLSVVIAKS